LSNPQGIALDRTNNRALVVDSELDALMSIDLTTGDRVILSDATIGSGTNLIYPRGVVLDSANNRALVIDSHLNALVAIDLATGERAISSR
jgi:DNA-binding beta-propeller fold protein YncE